MEIKPHCDFCEFLSCMKKVDKSEINWRQGEKPMYAAALIHGYPKTGKEHRHNDAWNIRPELLPGLRNEVGGRVDGTWRKELLHLRMA